MRSRLGPLGPPEEPPLGGLGGRGGPSARQHDRRGGLMAYAYELLIEIEGHDGELVADFLTGDVIDPRSGEVVGRVLIY